MNKLKYRVIFNRQRRMTMVVSEIAKAYSGGDSGLGNNTTMMQGSFNLRRLTLAMAIAAGLVFTPLANAKIVADKNAAGQQRPQVILSGNGTYQVNIQTPSKAGVSHNKYQQFDVDKKGAILNNSRKNVKTELGGYVAANRNLAGGEARIILNEVNAKNPSQLNGYVEVAGQRAQVIIANPSGITCNGCGFINANKSTLTTGRPIMEDGQLKGYQVKQGEVTINGRGLDDSRSDYTEIIARSVKVNAGIWANDLNIVTGRNHVSHDVNNIAKDTQSPDNTPELALDVAALGGMYAGKIRLVGTERGVGVNNQGIISSQHGGIHLTVDGKIVNQGTVNANKGDIQLASTRHITNQSGKIQTKTGNIRIDAVDNIENISGQIASDSGNIHLNTKKSFTNSKGSIAANKSDLTISAQDAITNTGTLHSEKATVLTTQALTNTNQITTFGDLTVDALTLNNAEQHSLISAGYQNAVEEHNAGNITLAVIDSIINQGTIQGKQSIALSTQALTNTHQISSLGNLTAQAQTLINSGKNSLIAVGAKEATNRDNSTGNITLTVKESLINQGAIQGTQSVTLATPSLTNQYIIASEQNLIIRTDELVNGKEGLLMAGFSSEGTANNKGHLDIVAKKATNSGALLSSNWLAMLGNTLELKENSEIIGKTNTLTYQESIHNNNALIDGNTLTLKTADLLNMEKAIINGKTLFIDSKNLTNYGLIDSEKARITSSTLNNLNSGRIYSNQLAIQSTTLNNLGAQDLSTAPVIAARESAYLGVGTLNNKDHAQLISSGSMAIGSKLNNSNEVEGAANAIYNNSAYIEAGGDLFIHTGMLKNVNDDLRTDFVKVHEERIIEYTPLGKTTRYKPNEIRIYNEGGKDNYKHLVTPDGGDTHKFYLYDYIYSIFETVITHTDPAKIRAGGSMNIKADTIINDNSEIIAGRKLTTQSRKLDNITTIGDRHIHQVGKVIFHDKEKHHTGIGDTKYTQKTSTSDYVPAIQKSKIDLKSVHMLDKQQITTLPANEQRSEFTSSLKDNAGNVLVIFPAITLPDNSLFVIHPEPGNQYLIETDPRFTNKKQWLSTDYMLAHLKAEPNTVIKRLGDGYYEQTLIRDQITQLTGQRYLDGYSDDLQQYKALMDNGIEFAQEYQLKMGIGLTTEQMQQLTSDIIWLVSQEVTLKDGSKQTVLYPQVYRAGGMALTASGALIAGENIDLSAKENISTSGSLIAKQTLNTHSNALLNEGSIKADLISLNAEHDITSHGLLVAENGLYINAKNDVNLLSTTRTTTGKQGDVTVIDQHALTQTNHGDLVINAGNDINLKAALVINQGKDGTTALRAGNQIDIDTVSIGDRENIIYDKDNYRKSATQKVVGSEIIGKGDVTLEAGDKLQIKASNVSADNTLTLKGDDITITSAQERSQLTEHNKKKEGSFVSKSTTEQHIELDDKTQQGSLISGKQVNVSSNTNLAIKGSQVTAVEDVNLIAGENITIHSADESRYYASETKTKKSGLMSSGGGLGVTIGKSKEQLDQKWNEGQQLSSVVGSTQGDVNIHAGKDVSVKGSDLIAKQDINVNGESITLKSADSTSRYDEHYKKVQSGLTLALTGSAAQVYDSAKAVHDSQQRGNDTLTALKAIQASLTAVEGYQNQQLGGDTQDKSIIGVSAKLGSQKTERNVAQEQHNVVGSNLSAGDSIRLTARGDDKGESGDITLKGSEVRAGQDIDIRAAGSLNAIAAVNTQNSDRKEESSGGGVGLNLSLGGSGGFSMGLNANANFSKEREHADGSAWSESIIDAGNALNVKTGQDVNLIGSQLKGDKITADVGNQLNIQSLQDSNNFDYDKLTASVSGGYGVGSTPIEANLSLSKTEMESHWASVTDQAGIFAGAQGFDITVKDNTDLKGAVIASQAEAEHNRLDTGTLTFSDIENKADYRVDHSSLSLGTSGPTVPMTYHDKDSASNTTHSAVAQGELTVRDSDKQQQDVNSLSRDTDNAHKELASIFDKQKQLDKIEVIESVVTIASQVTTVLENADKIAAEKQVADLQKDPEAYNAAVNELKNAGIITSTDNAVEVNNALITQQLAQSQLAMGGDLRQEITSATAIITGLISGNPLAGITGAAAPHLAELIKQQTENNPTLNTVSHAVLGAVVAELQGGSALAGATGAAVGENAARIIRENLYGNKPNDQLSPEEKEQISALSSLAAGLATAALSGSTIDATTSAGASKNAVENNYLNSQNVIDMKRELEEADKTGADKTAIYDKYDKISKENRDKAIAEIESGGSYDAIGAWEELNSGVNVADALKISALFDDLSSEDRAQLVNFVKAESAESAQAIYNSLSLTAKVALQGKEIAENSGIKGSLPGSGVSSLGIKGGGNKGNKQPYQPNQGAVGNMNEFLKQPNFGSQSKDSSSKTSKVYQGQSVYQASKDIGSNIKKGDQFYLDGQHKNHLEVFDKRGNFKAVLNLDGSVNQAKTDAAMGRKLK